jgi:hypothetical protein
VNSRKNVVILNSEEARLKSRLVGCVPAATLELEAFCKLAGVRVSREIPSAAVECLRRPRLLVNPDFAAKYCQRDEHLFLLVMHELWHIILAHTRLYPRVTPAHNVAFDAIINAGLARAYYDKPEFRGFFEALNPPDKFPSLLLSPPAGWPTAPVYPPDDPEGTRYIVERLYPPPGAPRDTMPFYSEILRLLIEYIEANGGIWIEGDPILIGDHDDAEDEGHVLDDPMLSEALQRVAGSMRDQLGAQGRGVGGKIADKASALVPPRENARRTFSVVLRRCLGTQRGNETRREKSPVTSVTGNSVLPNPRDRLAPARRLLGMPETIWAQPGTVRARVPEVPRKAHVYLDVSGSMVNVLPHLLGLILPYVAHEQADVFQFSTQVEALNLAQLQLGRLRTTSGTNINCVLKHLFAQKPIVQRVLILTDGATGKPMRLFVDQARDQNTQIYVVLPSESAHQEDLRAIATSMTILPPLGG